MVQLTIKVFQTKIKTKTKRRLVLFLLAILVVTYIKILSITIHSTNSVLKNALISGLYNITNISKLVQEKSSLKSVQMQSETKEFGYFKYNINSKILEEDKLSVADIWPVDGGELSDRIEKQLSYKPKVHGWKTILMHGWGNNDAMEANHRLMTENCPVTNCTMISDFKRYNESDAVISKFIQLDTNEERPSGQIRIYHDLESPMRSILWDSYDNSLNITATYRRDSVLVTPYAKFVKITDSKLELQKDYASGKKKSVAWFVTNCHAGNGRLAYAQALMNYIDVDIYGHCGNLICDRWEEDKCFKMLNKHYKFYLSFENANCVDYITEKFFINGLSNDIIPIVMGARREDYEAVAPPHSFIHVDDFESPKGLAEYLHMLNNNDHLYNQYFSWKGTMELINTRFYCRLCSLVHAADQHTFTITDAYRWWSSNETCRTPRYNQKWASWRH